MDFIDLMRIAFEISDDPRYWADEFEVSVPSIKRWRAGTHSPLPTLKRHVAKVLREKFSQLVKNAVDRHALDSVSLELGIDPVTLASYIAGNELPEFEVVTHVIHGVRDLAE